jgi:hypothetical protein
MEIKAIRKIGMDIQFNEILPSSRTFQFVRTTITLQSLKDNQVIIILARIHTVISYNAAETAKAKSGLRTKWQI